MRTRVLMLLFAAIPSILYAQKQVTISAKVQFVDEKQNKVMVTKRNGFEQIVLGETIIKPDNTYTVSLNVNKGEVAYVSCSSQRVRIWLEDENMSIDFRGKDTAKVKIINPPFVYIKGGAKNELMNLANFSSHRAYQMMIAASQAVYGQESLDKEMKSTIASQLYKDNNTDKEAYLKYLIEHYSHLTSSVALIQLLDYNANKELIEKALNNIEKANPGTSVADNYRKKLAETDDLKKKASVGYPAPDFTCPDQSGKMVSLKSFKGKVVIVDFWASWCGPCRQEIPNVKKYYKEFKSNKDVVFISVSIDSKKADWEKALKEEQCEWIQLLAPNSGRDVMKSYQFNGIPFIVAIGKDGKIFRRTLRGEAIRQAVVDALNK